jgi:hypothetical protein
MANKKFPVVVQMWIESEAGWGQRPDGITVHLDTESCKKYVEKYWENEKKRNPSGKTPECYSREDGRPIVKSVGEKIYQRLVENHKKGHFGISFWSMRDMETEDKKAEAETKKIQKLKLDLSIPGL